MKSLARPISIFAEFNKEPLSGQNAIEGKIYEALGNFDGA
jgi:hypothetical protein